MRKLTDPGYFLPKIHAQVGGKEYTTGATRPIEVIGVCEVTGKRDRYVAKLSRASRMSGEACSRELLACWIGNELDIKTVEPALIEVSTEFAETTKGKDYWSTVNNSIGTNFGSKHVTGHWTFSPNEVLTNHQIEYAIQVFAFDVLLANADRTNDKPNMFTNGKDVIIYDHELSFSFLKVLSFLRTKTPWVILEDDLKWIRKHYFFQPLKREKIDFSSFVNKLNRLDENFWRCVNNWMPTNWFCNDIAEIRCHIDLVTAHRDEFSKELSTILLQ